MKQNITVHQWNELTEKEKWAFIQWFNKKDFQQKTGSMEIIGFNSRWYPLPSIGQMIEFLGDKWFEQIRFVAGSEGLVKLEDSFDDIYYINNKGLCDALWEAVKERLNE